MNINIYTANICPFCSELLCCRITQLLYVQCIDCGLLAWEIRFRFRAEVEKTKCSKYLADLPFFSVEYKALLHL
jgi:hypothetical protein